MAVAATGFFDGVHLGHRAVIDSLLLSAGERGEQSLVLSFWPHPRVVLQSDARTLRLLTSREEKTALLRSLGVDRVEILPFDRSFASLTAGEYLELLRSRYGVDALVLGHDNRFGSDGLSTTRIASLAREAGFGVEVVPPVIWPCGEGGSPVSSTRIRKALEEGEVENAAAMLGRFYSLDGVVVPGNRMGRTIDFPTANMKLREPLKCLPKPAAYLSRCTVGGREYFSMTNIDRQQKIETNIFDFNSDIYGFDIRVEFVRKIRDELHFSSFAELRNQLLLDRESARHWVRYEVA